MIDAVVFDLDGVLVDSEALWARAREELVRARGGTWRDEATRAMMGMSSPEWSRYMHEELRVPISPQEIVREVLARLEELYRRELPLVAGAREAVTSLAARFRLGVASSANRPLIELVLDLAGIRESFTATVSAEEVQRGKPAPDVYVEAARRLAVPLMRCAAVEDSTNGLLAAAAAGMAVIALPNKQFPPSADALARADVVLGTLEELRPKLVDGLAAR
jgi:HAD superfamily hydrolase (TIGR01509 family)